VYFLLSVSSEVFRRMMMMRVLYRQLGIDTSIPRDAPELLPSVRGSFGGRLVVLDWGAGEVLADKAIPGATGIATWDHIIVACSWIDQCCYVVRPDEDDVSITHPWFNYLHSVDRTPWGTILLASAGSDAIMEITSNGDVVWEWFGPEHGYDTRPDGSLLVTDRSVDYRPLRIGTTDQAMHVTSATVLADGTLLATLFHQGTLVAIDQATGRARTVMAGLHCPHGVHPWDDAVLLSDTLGHRILVLDKELRVASEIPFGSQWLQDAIPSSAGTYLTLENVHIDQVPGPGLANRVTEIDPSGAPLRQLVVDPDFRLFTVREIDAGLAGTLARTWGTSGSMSDWHWT
jgi:hypothetical protein